jgi:homogentisate 1,2-dioxygenase
VSSLAHPLLRAFESGELDAKDFKHRAHLQVAWCYLRALPLDEAAARFIEGLRRIATRAGVPEKLDVAMTHAYFAALDQAMRDPALCGATLDQLLAAHPALLRRPAPARA